MIIMTWMRWNSYFKFMIIIIKSHDVLWYDLIYLYLFCSLISWKHEQFLTIIFQFTRLLYWKNVFVFLCYKCSNQAVKHLQIYQTNPICGHSNFSQLTRLEDKMSSDISMILRILQQNHAVVDPVIAKLTPSGDGIHLKQDDDPFPPPPPEADLASCQVSTSFHRAQLIMSLACITLYTVLCTTKNFKREQIGDN